MGWLGRPGHDGQASLAVVGQETARGGTGRPAAKAARAGDGARDRPDKWQAKELEKKRCGQGLAADRGNQRANLQISGGTNKLLARRPSLASPAKATVRGDGHGYMEPGGLQRSNLIAIATMRLGGPAPARPEALARRRRSATRPSPWASGSTKRRPPRRTIGKERVSTRRWRDGPDGLSACASQPRPPGSCPFPTALPPSPIGATKKRGPALGTKLARNGRRTGRASRGRGGGKTGQGGSDLACMRKAYYCASTQSRTMRGEECANGRGRTGGGGQEAETPTIKKRRWGSRTRGSSCQPRAGVEKAPQPRINQCQLYSHSDELLHVCCPRTCARLYCVRIGAARVFVMEQGQ